MVVGSVGQFAAMGGEEGGRVGRSMLGYTEMVSGECAQCFVQRFVASGGQGVRARR